MMQEMETMSQAIARLHKAGYTDDFRAENGELKAIVAMKSYAPPELSVEEIVRFEGETDLDEEAVIFALHDKVTGTKGTYVAAFSTHMDGQDSDMVRLLQHLNHGKNR